MYIQIDFQYILNKFVKMFFKIAIKMKKKSGQLLHVYIRL